MHYVWKYQAFDRKALQTSAGEPIEVWAGGFHNDHAGPDFEQARLRLGKTLWAGQVELHLRSSDWYRHGHHQDPAYRNVILHVVYEEDRPVFDQQGQALPTLVLAPRIDHHHYWNYERLKGSGQLIPCGAHLGAIDPIYVSKMLERTAVERLSEQAKRWARVWQHYRGDWQGSFHLALAEGFGLPLNRQPMEQLAAAMPVQRFKRLSSRVEREAWAFGLAGILAEAPLDPYVQELREAFAFLRHKWKLVPGGAMLWKYARTRPANFPDIRIAQWLALLNELDRPLDLLYLSPAQLRHRMRELPMAEYWQVHYRLGQMSVRHSGQPGTVSWHNLLINVVAPFLFLYGQKRQEPAQEERALDLLSALPAEQNRITRLYQQFKVPVSNALDSQACLQLHRQYCRNKKCLNCGIGIQLLKPKEND